MKKHLYFVSGMAANSKVFERMIFPTDRFEVHYLEWLIPLSKEETLENYAKRMCKKIKTPNPILIGVSFGGVLVQEMSKIISHEKVMIISSIKITKELPWRLRFFRDTKLYKVFYSQVIELFVNALFLVSGKGGLKRKKLYEKYLTVRNPIFLNWAVDKLLNWKQETAIEKLVHIHGEYDNVFPIKYIRTCISISKGTHAMILTKASTLQKTILNCLE
ncbi:MAG: alpha/beta hydrolase [Flavicella sp.]